jgi:NAD-dependent DNA ligase
LTQNANHLHVNVELNHHCYHYHYGIGRNVEINQERVKVMDDQYDEVLNELDNMEEFDQNQIE